MMMDDEEKVPTLNEVQNAFGRARRAHYVQAAGWQNEWLAALDSLGIYLGPWSDRREPLIDQLMDLRMFVDATADLLRDECIGAKPHFWQQPQNRPPKTVDDWFEMAAAVSLIAACRERERRIGSGRNAYEAGQAELRRRGVQITQAKLRSFVSNASRMPKSHRERIAFEREQLRAEGTNPEIFVKFFADAFARLKMRL